MQVTNCEGVICDLERHAVSSRACVEGEVYEVRGCLAIQAQAHGRIDDDLYELIENSPR